MLPIRDSIPSRRAAWVTWALVAGNVVAFVWVLAQGEGLPGLLYQFGVVPSQWMVRSLSDFLEWPRLFLTLVTSQFLHAGVLHLGLNLLYLWIFGEHVEDRLGHGRFLGLYVASGAVGALVQILAVPRSGLPVVGASGAIAGVLAAYLLLFPTARVVTLVPRGWRWRTMEVPAFIFLGLWFLLQWLRGLATIGQVADLGGVAFWAHIGGFASGLVWAFVLVRQPRWRSPQL